MPPTNYEFEFLQVESQTTLVVRQALEDRHGLCVIGRPGVGKTWSVAQAVNGALWSTVPNTSYAVPRVLADLAAQTSYAQSVLQVYDEQGCEAACAALDRAIGDRTLVLDSVENLWSVRAPDGLDEPDVPGLWADEFEALRSWARRRVETTRTVLIGRRLTAPAEPHVCRPPETWPVKLRYSGSGFVPWQDVADRVAHNPSALFLAAATLRLAGPGAIQQWLDDTGDADPEQAVSGLSDLLRQSAPTELSRLLAALSGAGEAERALLDELAAEEEDLDFALALARELHLLEERAGVVRLVPFLRDANTIQPTDEACAEPLLRRLATRILARVNDRRSLEPGNARRVLDAHRLQLAVGDFDGAQTTARLHLGGLVSHARALSLGANSPSEFDRARRAYGEVRSLLRAHPRYAGTRVASYVSHYHGYNGHRGQTLSLGEVAGDYDSAIDAWPENALWHARRIALAAESGDEKGALASRQAALDAVPPHERRDGYLTIRAAKWCSDAHADHVAFRLLEGYEPPPNLSAADPVAFPHHRRLLSRWAHGVGCERLADGAGREVLFHRPLRLIVESEADGRWSASLEFPPLRAEGAGPASAAQALAAALADECLRLVRTPTGRLTATEVARKGLYLGAVDLPGSQIGLPFHSHRWLLGTVAGRTFTPSQVDLEPIPLAPAIVPATEQGRFLAKVPVDRTGYPNAPVERLVEAGSGRNTEALLFVLKRLAHEEDDAA